jgi:hypothetical protein
MHDGKTTNEPRGQSMLTLSLMALTGLVRLLPHPWNFTPVGALGLYGGARLRWWQAFFVPFLVMGVTDFLIWTIKGWHFNPAVYGCFAVNVLLGLSLRRTSSVWRIAGCSFAGSLLFYLVTNFSVWLTSIQKFPDEVPGGAAYVMVAPDQNYDWPEIHYAKNVQGLAACYWMGLSYQRDGAPFGFAGNIFVGDLFFTGLLFGAHAFLLRRRGVTATASMRTT